MAAATTWIHVCLLRHVAGLSGQSPLLPTPGPAAGQGNGGDWVAPWHPPPQGPGEWQDGSQVQGYEGYEGYPVSVLKLSKLFKVIDQSGNRGKIKMLLCLEVLCFLALAHCLVWFVRRWYQTHLKKVCGLFFMC